MPHDKTDNVIRMLYERENQFTHIKTTQGIVGPLRVNARTYVPTTLPSNCKKPVRRFRTNRRKNNVTPMLNRCFQLGLDEGMRI
jgi:hypothetical protein